MSKVVLVTGGAGFIGSHLCDDLLEAGYKVKVLDSLSQQVHGPDLERPEYLSPDVELILGDVRDAEAMRRALVGVDAVYHFAAKVGVGQSMYEIASYTATNNDGTAVLLEALIKRPVEKLVVASSMSIYGEGLYRNARGELVSGTERPLEQLQMHDWEVRDSEGNVLTAVATPETKPPTLASVYA
ncbi:MAG TPA: SDR family NAD(P)-dependent oxidoreductase, partial [Verrucomicrobiae bacterium]